MANLRTKILDFGGFDSSRILTSKGEILMFMGNFPQGLGQQVLAGIILVGRLGVRPSRVYLSGASLCFGEPGPSIEKGPDEGLAQKMVNASARSLQRT